MSELSTIRRAYSLVSVLSLTPIAFSIGCSGDSGNGSGSTALGGGSGVNTTSTGGTTSTPVTTSNTGGTESATGGANTSLGGANTGIVTTGGTTSEATGGAGIGGNTAAIGGSQTTGGTASAGGTSSSGGSKSTGGTAASTGGTKATGGTSSTGGSTATGGSSSCISAGITKNSEATIATDGLSTVSYEGYLNGESFQQEGIISYNGYQYTAYWNNAATRQVVLARRPLTPTIGAWSKIVFTDYTPNAADAHNTISLGIAPGDGTLHLSFDHHGQTLNYRKSVANLVTNPTGVAWTTASFGTVLHALVGTTSVANVTYPRFVTEPGGTKMLFSARIGTSGAGDEHLWEYNTASGTWTFVGMYINGNIAASTTNAYLHGLSYTKNGSRLHASWCWRETPNPYTNHDLFYVYSDDHGRNWKNSAGTTVGTTGSNYITTSSDAKVVTIAQNRGLINQEHMAVDSLGRVHVLLSHVPDGTSTTANDFTAQRTKAQYFHYLRDTNGTWTVKNIAATPVQRNFRGKFVISTTNNVYAVLPTPRTTTSSIYDANMVLAGASPCNNYAWTVLATDSSRSYFSDPLVDVSKLLSTNELTIVNQQETSGNIWGFEYTLK